MKFARYSRKALAVLLSLLLLLAALGAGASAAPAACSCRELPRVFVPGIGAPLYRSFGLPEQETLGVVDLAGLRAAILPVALKLIQAVAQKSWDPAADALSALAYGMFRHLLVDEEGVSAQPVTARAVLNPDQDHRNGGMYVFEYDWRMDPMESAMALHAFIQDVKEATGHEKVALIPTSEGACIAMAYFAQYEYNDIAHYIPVAGAHNGLTMVGELFNRNVELSADITAEYMRSIARTMGEGAIRLLIPLADLLEQSGLVDLLVRALSVLLDNCADKVFDDALIPLFVQWPALWAFVPDEYYESAKTALLGDAKYDNFKVMIDAYHYAAGPGLADGLLLEASKTARVSIMACYGLPSQPFAPNLRGVDADGLIDTARESSGAVTAGLWSTFPADYTQQGADCHGHISPDRRVDASTCLFPDQTWFFKYTSHFDCIYENFLDFLIYSETPPTVFTSGDWPQFLTHNGDGTFRPTAPEEAPARGMTLLRSIWSLIIAALRVAWVQIFEPLQSKI
ncbi:MAG: hypothetical protein FWH26_03375 [Oscillospiraceae bacterium]|nr:hypothetical protein [Oscillospiraceae bacterium]